MGTERLQDKARFLALWLLAGIISYSVGFPASLALGGTVAWGWIIGGGLTVLCQYLLLRKQVSRSVWWIAASTVGLISGTAVSLAISQPAIQRFGLTPAFILVGASVGLGLGLGQWAVLRSQFRLAVWWAPISTAGYALGLVSAVNSPLSIPMDTSLAFGPEVGGTLGAVSGAITGTALLWITQTSKPQLSASG